MRDRILINKELIPYSYEIVLGNELFEFSVDYNKTGDLFTISLYKGGNLIVTEPLIYNRALFKDVYMIGRYPCLEIVPLDESNERHAVIWDNFNDTVFLTIDDMA